MPNPRINAAQMKAKALKKAKENKVKSKKGSPTKKTGKAKPKTGKAKPAAAVKNALEGMAAFPGSVFLIPIIAGAAAGLARTAFNSLIPEFAAGGLVTGPTTALIGEGSGTSMANPEVVAPLDKLKQYMGGGSNVTVTGRLVGNDIYLSNERTKFNRNRTV